MSVSKEGLGLRGLSGLRGEILSGLRGEWFKYLRFKGGDLKVSGGSDLSILGGLRGEIRPENEDDERQESREHRATPLFH